MKILILNGTNLNRLGQREPEIYGTATLDELLADLRTRLPQHELTHLQSNHEGVLIDALHASATDGTQGIVFNPGAYSHTSYALADAIKSIAPLPVVEVHLSNLYARAEGWRHRSVTAAACRGVVSGFGFVSYFLGVTALEIEAHKG